MKASLKSAENRTPPNLAVRHNSEKSVQSGLVKLQDLYSGMEAAKKEVPNNPTPVLQLRGVRFWQRNRI